MDLGLAGRKALVTGGSRGIGFACAACLVREGADVTIVARDEARLKESAAALGKEGKGRAAWLAADLGKPGEAERVANEAGAVDILVNNAGAIPPGTLFDMDEARWHEAWDLKVFGYINLTRAVLAEMAKRGGGAIVNVIGAAGERPEAGYITGGAGNAALMAFTRALGGRSIDDGVRVVAVNPGLVMTDRMKVMLSRNEKDGDGGAAHLKKLDLPRGRAAKPEEIADVVVFLASDRASYVSGTTVTIDCGAGSRAKTR